MPSLISTIMRVVIGAIMLCVFVGLIVLIFRALLKYVKAKEVRKEKAVRKKLLEMQ